MNSGALIGNLTKDPELRAVGETSVTTMFVAVNEKYKSNDGTLKEETGFYKVEAWGKRGEVCVEHLTKGSKVAVLGSLRQSKWEDKEGNKRTDTYIRANSVDFLSKKNDTIATEETPF
jgi:single-strand DNA-binding protein